MPPRKRKLIIRAIIAIILRVNSIKINYGLGQWDPHPEVVERNEAEMSVAETDMVNAATLAAVNSTNTGELTITADSPPALQALAAAGVQEIQFVAEGPPPSWPNDAKSEGDYSAGQLEDIDALGILVSDQT